MAINLFQILSDIVLILKTSVVNSGSLINGPVI